MSLLAARHRIHGRGRVRFENLGCLDGELRSLGRDAFFQVGHALLELRHTFLERLVRTGKRVQHGLNVLGVMGHGVPELCEFGFSQLRCLESLEVVFQRAQTLLQGRQPAIRSALALQ
jgi:hypothetical protein